MATPISEGKPKEMNILDRAGDYLFDEVPVGSGCIKFALGVSGLCFSFFFSSRRRHTRCPFGRAQRNRRPAVAMSATRHRFRMSMTGRQFLLTLILLLGFSAQALASPLPLIVQISPAASIATIATVLGGSLIDTIPGDNLYLLSVPAVPPSFLASTLGIEWMELNI